MDWIIALIVFFLSGGWLATCFVAVAKTPINEEVPVWRVGLSLAAVVALAGTIIWMIQRTGIFDC